MTPFQDEIVSDVDAVGRFYGHRPRFSDWLDWYGADPEELRAALNGLAEDGLFERRVCGDYVIYAPHGYCPELPRKRHAVAERLYGLLRGRASGGTVTAPQCRLSVELDIHTKFVRSALDVLTSDGRLKRMGKGPYGGFVYQIAA